RRNVRRGHHARRNAGVVQRLDRLESFLRRRRARLHFPRQRAIERRHRHVHLDQPVAGHRGKEVEIAQDEVRFGDDGERMADMAQDLDQRARDAILPLDRLIGIGVSAERDGRRPILGRSKLTLQELGCALLGEQARLEIEPGGEPQIGVGRPRVAIEAAVFAAAVGVDRSVERNVGRLVAGDDNLWPFQNNLGRQRLGRLLACPAIVEILVLLEFETAGDVGRRAASAPPLGGHKAFGDRLRAMAGVDGGGTDQGRVHSRPSLAEKSEQIMNKAIALDHRRVKSVSQRGTPVLAWSERERAEAAMQRRKLGANGPEVGAIGLGCMGMSVFYGPADRAESIATIHATLDSGATLIDTADFYGSGHNELLIGEALKGRRREGYVLSAKFGALRDPAAGFIGYDARPGAVKNFLAYALKRLGVDAIDIYRPARLDPDVPIEDTIG